MKTLVAALALTLAAMTQPAAAQETSQPQRWTLVIHGGAGTIDRNRA